MLMDKSLIAFEHESVNENMDSGINNVSEEGREMKSES
jgi:hypothetical protein